MFSGVLFVAGLFVLLEVSSAATKNEVLVLKTILCDKDMKETGDLIDKCFNVLQVPSKFDNMAKKCCTGLDFSKSLMIREWYCKTSYESIMKCNDCLEATIKENGEEEEMKNVTIPFRDCIMLSM
ncbi:hypothetical protein JTE90_024567 [Oedothorax gibbosus]|uniref:Uncharacterized protein n=1 Tax=Oedothorax gibbosus TaxID=931172 RepID=A0AAV6VEU6_9ARAC|nr:hypothetical protein JTE90_024567 [Oedothorax gibbosus]